eukprot:4876425-Prymnesium_polylepis.4
MHAALPIRAIIGCGEIQHERKHRSLLEFYMFAHLLSVHVCLGPRDAPRLHLSKIEDEACVVVCRWLVHVYDANVQLAAREPRRHIVNR